MRNVVLYFFAVSSLSVACHFTLVHAKLPEHVSLQEIAIPTVQKIRVLIHEYPINQETKFIIKSRHGFILRSPVECTLSSVYHNQELRLRCKDGSLFMLCDNEKYRKISYDNIEVSDPHRELTYAGTTYQGSLIFQLDAAHNRVIVVNKLPLEDYIYSVVRYEGIPSWPIGMQKLQAIVSRTYALHLVQQHKNNPQFKYYDIKNTNLHQVYNGVHGFTHLRQAVDETRGMIVTHHNKIALTMFDTCCGGTIPANMRHKKDVTKPYLYRTQRCLHCAKTPLFQWKADLHVKTFLQGLKDSPQLASKFKQFGQTISRLKVIDTDKAGRVHQVEFCGSNNQRVVVTGTQIRNSFLHKIRSISFTIKKINDRIVIHGKGVGHQQGLCQWGSRELLKKGWNLKKILSFYYPGTKLGKIVEQ